MRFFRRRREPEPLDASFGFMTQARAARFRDVVQDTLAQLRVEAVVHDDQVVTAGGAVHGLWDLATSAEAHDEAAWPELVQGHFARLVRPHAAPEDMSADDLLAAVRLQLSEESFVRSMPDTPARAEPFAPGITRHLVLDTTESVRTAPDAVLLATVPADRLDDAAWRSARAVLTEDLGSEVFGADDAPVHVVFGESFYVGTLALFLPEAVHRFAPDADLTNGVVFSVPMRHQFAFHLPTGAEPLRRVLPEFLRFTRAGYAEGSGPVSPHLYHWQDGIVTALTTDGERGRTVLTPAGRVADLLGPNPTLTQ